MGISYKIKITPNNAFFDRLLLWMPIPYNLRPNDVCFSLTPKKISQEKKFGNKMAYFEIERRIVGNKLIIEEKFELSELKQNYFFSDFCFKDYKKDKEYKKYITCDSYIQSNSEVLKSVAKKIKGVRKNLLSIIRNFYDYILSILTYGNPTFGLYTSLQAFDFRIVDCGGFSTLFCALCQAVGVPSRVVTGYLIKKNRAGVIHAWSEFFLPDRKWIPVDLAMAKLAGKDYFGKLYEKRVIFSKGTDFDLIPPLPDKEKASILQSYYLRLNEGAEIGNLQIETEIGI